MIDFADKRWLTTPAAALLLALMTAALAGDGVKTVTVTATEYQFEPSRIQARAGQRLRIELVNNGNISHNLHIVGAEARTQTVAAGDSDSVQLTVPTKGEVRYVCKVPGHKQAGMSGRIVVD